MVSLAVSYDPRRNTLDAVRVGLALIVAVSHGIAMRTGSQPSWGNTDLGGLAVDGFFVLSGFLVTGSYQRIDGSTGHAGFWTVVRFGWHRFLRIMPGFWLCLTVLALVVAPLVAVLEGRPVATPFVTDPSSWLFLVSNAGLLIRQYDIAGLLAGNPAPFVFDGALWTLALEAMCYVLLAVLGWSGVVRRRRWVVLVLAGVLLALLIAQTLGVDTVIGDQTTRLGLMFLLGVASYLFKERIPISPTWAVAASILLIGCLAFLHDYRVVGAPALAYLIVYLGTGLPRPVRLRADLSYGIYIYHWPTEQVLMLTVASALPTVAFVIISLATVLLPAAASWLLIEKRSLKQKDFAPLSAWRSRRQPAEVVTELSVDGELFRHRSSRRAPQVDHRGQL
jgi:peptidoglycan/LPS O-acetylase OafA/YrhL